MAILCGTVFAVYALGGYVLDPADTGWFKDDVRTYFIGWQFLRDDTWHWPLTWTGHLAYPTGIAAADLDIDPLLAIPFKALSPFLPQPFQYFGIGAWAACCLQAYFGFRFLRAFQPENHGLVLLGGLLFLIAPPFAFRLWIGHFSLANQWLILAALAQFRPLREFGAARKIVLTLLLLNAAAAAINPYLEAMLFLVSLFVFLKLRREGSLSSAFGLGGLASCFLAALLVLCAVGFISGGEVEAYAGAAYREFSMNLLAIIDPARSPSPLLPAEPSFPRQYEGYNYFGIGLIFLITVALSFRKNRDALFRDDNYAPQRTLFLIAAALAVFPRVTAGHWVIVDLWEPAAIRRVASIFRATGRFFWPAYYLALGAAILGIGRIFRPRAAAVLVGAALVLQFWDTSSLLTASHIKWNTPEAASPLRAPLWQSLGTRAAHLDIEPAFQCDTDLAPGAMAGIWYFGDLAARQGMTMNSVYAARLPVRNREACTTQTANLLAHGLDPDTAYVFTESDVMRNLVAMPRMTRCVPADGFVICAPDIAGAPIPPNESTAGAVIPSVAP